MSVLMIPKFVLVEFDPSTVSIADRQLQYDLLELPGKFSIDGPNLRCDLQSYWCEGRAAGAGGFDEHHLWPVFLGGPETSADKLVLCAIHHRRVHALIRAMVEHGSTAVNTVVHFSDHEHTVASYGVAKWLANDKPTIAGWSCPAAALKAA